MENPAFTGFDSNWGVMWGIPVKPHFRPNTDVRQVVTSGSSERR
jgi:hypothetical protein